MEIEKEAMANDKAWKVEALERTTADEMEKRHAGHKLIPDFRSLPPGFERRAGGGIGFLGV